MPNELESKFVNLRQLSIITSIPLSSLRRFASERRFVLYKLNSRILVSLDDFEKFMEESKIQPRKGGNYEK